MEQLGTAWNAGSLFTIRPGVMGKESVPDLLLFINPLHARLKKWHDLRAYEMHAI